MVYNHDICIISGVHFIIGLRARKYQWQLVTRVITTIRVKLSEKIIRLSESMCRRLSQLIINHASFLLFPVL